MKKLPNTKSFNSAVTEADDRVSIINEEKHGSMPKPKPARSIPPSKKPPIGKLPAGPLFGE